MTYNEMHQIFNVAQNNHRDDSEFSGFRWMNCSKVKNIIKDRLIKAKKSGLMERDENGQLIAYPGLASEVIESARESILSKSRKTIERLGDDNGWAENCLLFLSRVEQEVADEIKRREGR